MKKQRGKGQTWHIVWKGEGGGRKNEYTPKEGSGQRDLQEGEILGGCKVSTIRGRARASGGRSEGNQTPASSGKGAGSHEEPKTHIRNAKQTGRKARSKKHVQ